MSNLPYDPIPAVSSTANPNVDLPPDDFPSLVRIIVVDLVGPLAANQQDRAFEKRDEYLRSIIVKLVDGYNTLDVTFLRRDASNPKDSNPGVRADMPFNGFLPTGLGTPTANDHGTNKIYVDTAVSNEASARSSADTTLQNNINSEASTRSSADSTEAGTRASSDTTLQNNINAEALARSNADSAEAGTRASADSTLQTNINNEANTRSSADTTLQGSITTEVNRAVAAEALKAPLASPTLTGVPAAPTATTGTNTTQIATTAFVMASVAGFAFSTLITTSTTFVAPRTGYYNVILVSGGGGGGGGSGGSGGGGAYQGKAGFVMMVRVLLSAAQNVSVVIGSYGIGGAGQDTAAGGNGTAGGVTSFGSFASPVGLGGLGALQSGWYQLPAQYGDNNAVGGGLGGATPRGPSGGVFDGWGGAGGLCVTTNGSVAPQVLAGDGQDWPSFALGGKAGQGYGAGGGGGGGHFSGLGSGNGGNGAPGAVYVFAS